MEKEKQRKINEMIPVIQYTFVQPTRGKKEQIAKYHIELLRNCIFDDAYFSRSWIQDLFVQTRFKNTMVSPSYHFRFPIVKFVLHNLGISVDVADIVQSYMSNPTTTYNGSGYHEAQAVFCHAFQQKCIHQSLEKHQRTKQHTRKTEPGSVPAYLK